MITTIDELNVLDILIVVAFPINIYDILNYMSELITSINIRALMLKKLQNLC